MGTFTPFKFNFIINKSFMKTQKSFTRQNLRKKLGGFTLIELLIVISIIVLLTTVILVFVHGSILQARDSKRLAEVDSLNKALELYYTDQGKYPETSGWVKIEEDAKEEGPFSQAVKPYLSQIPEDPLYPKVENPDTENEKVFSYQYKSAEDGSDYKIHVEMETEKYSYPSYEIYSTGGGGIIYDIIAPTITNTAPAVNAKIREQKVSYTLSETAKDGTGIIVFTRTSGAEDSNSPHICILQGAALDSGTHANLTLETNANACTNWAYPLVDGTIYTVTFDANDAADNPAIQISNTNVAYDTAPPTITNTAPATNAKIREPKVSYTLSEAAKDTTGIIAFIRTNGTEDPNSPHICILQGTALDPGTHSDLILETTADSCVNWAYPLVGGTIYTVTFNAKDEAGNRADQISNTNVAYDTAPPALAEVTPVPTPAHDTTPDYTFSSNEPGTITYGGDCSSAITAAAAGNNTITFNELSEGTHSNCTITVTDIVGNTSLALSVTAFTITSEDYSLTDCSEVSSVAAGGGAYYVQTANYIMEASGGTLYWAFGGGNNKAYLYYSTDQGASWAEKKVLNTSGSVYSTHLLQDLNGNLYWSFAAGYAYLYRSPPGGNEWSQVKTIDTVTSYAESLFRSSDGVFYWAIGNISYSAGGAKAQIYRSTDGVNWNIQRQIYDGGTLTSTHLLEGANHYLYWSMGSESSQQGKKELLYRSVDGGLTWNPSLEVVGVNRVKADHLLEASNGYLYLSFGGDDRIAHLYRSYQGESWVQLKTFPTLKDIYDVHLLEDFWGNLYWSFGEQGNAHLYRSSDWGVTWENKADIPSGDAYSTWLADYLLRSSTNDGLYWIYTEDGFKGRAFLYESMDGGESWQERKKIEIQPYGGNLGYAPEVFLFEDSNQHLFWSFVAENVHLYRCDLPRRPREQTTLPQWAMFLHDPQHTGSNSEAPSASDNIIWEFPRGGAGLNETDWVVIGTDGIVYTATQNKIYALDPVTGQQKWPQPFTISAVSPDVRITSAPAISSLVTKNGDVLSQSVIYVLLSYVYGGGRSKLVAIDSDNGNVVQERDLTEISGTHSPLTLSEGVLYVGDSSGHLWAINSSNFTIKWKYPAVGSIGTIRYSTPAVSPDGSTVYIGSEDGYLYAVNASDGTEKWKFNTGRTVYASPSIAPDNSAIYIESYCKGIFALNPVNGNTIWPNPAMKDQCSYGSTAIGPDGTIYAEIGYYLHAINPDGTEKAGWPYLLDGNGNLNAVPAVASDGTAYLYSWESSYMYAVNPDGTERWKEDLGLYGEMHNQSPVIANDGTVYVISRNGILYAFK